jgi:hypothetical protein
MSKPTTHLRLGRWTVAALAVLVLSGVTACQPGDEHAIQSASTSTQPTKPIAGSNVRYLSPTGRDVWPGTKLQPWRTLRRALPSMRPDQTLYMRAGEYHEALVKVHVHPGTKRRPITMMAYPGEHPVVHGLVWLRQPSYWQFSGINVTWDPAVRSGTRPMVKVTGGVGWSWRDSDIWGSQGSANMVIAGYRHKEPADWTLADNCIHDVRPSRLIKRSSNLTVGNMQGGPGSVTRNLIFNAPGPQNVVIGSAQGGVRDVTFDFNTLFGAGVAVAVGGKSSDVRISRNILGGVSSDILIRWNHPHGGRNLVSQNLGGKALVFLRPFAEAVVGGHGNLIDSDLGFSNVSTCHGFHSSKAGTLPYGVYAIG